MPGRSAKKPTRQVKTLGALVLSMTLGTLLLSWIHDLTPIKRSNAITIISTANRPWTAITVRTVTPTGLNTDGSVRGFCHLYVDRDGIVHESSAWRGEQQDPHARGTIQVAVGVDEHSADLTPRQWKRLADVIAHLQNIHRIARDQVFVAKSYAGNGDTDAQQERLSAMLKTR